MLTCLLKFAFKKKDIEMSQNHITSYIIDLTQLR